MITEQAVLDVRPGEEQTVEHFAPVTGA